MAERQLYPRPEYPRPERQRGTREGYDWLNLNGPWEFRFDGDRAGIDEHWFAPAPGHWREQIIVPFCWESLAAWGDGEAAGNEHYHSTRPFLNPLNVDRSNYRIAPRYEVGWYRREVTLPDNETWHGRRAILTVGAADFFTDCWCNGTHLGHHEGGYTPFEFDLTDALERDPRTGELRGTIVFRVEDPMDNREQPVGKQWRWYTPTSGIWQTVFIEPRSASHIESFRIVPDIDAGIARFHFVCREAAGMTVHVTVTLPEGRGGQSADFDVTDGHAEGELHLDHLALWDPNHPHLYETVLTLQRDGSGIADRVCTCFGMRKIDSMPAEDPKAPAVLRINNQPRYLRGALYQSYFPEGVYTAGSLDRIIGDLKAAKDFGFNFLRVHIKIDDPQVYHWADKLGLLIMADFPNFGEGGDTDTGHRRFEVMMRKGIERDYNHPCIFAWCLFNETWGFGGQVGFVDLISPLDGPATAAATLPGPQSKLRNLASHAWVRDMWELAKSLDATRLIEDMSVCHWGHLEYFLHGDTDINSWHFYSHDYNYAKKHIASVVENTYRGSEFNYVPGYAHGGEPLINSEYGGVGALDGDRDVSWSFKFLTNELRRHGAISAYIYTELTDLEWEYNGFLNYDRSPKRFGYDPRTINAADQLPVNAPPIQKVSPGATIVIPVASSHYSVTRRENVTLRWRLSGIDTVGRLHQDLLAGEMPIDFPHRRVITVARLELEMPGFPVLATLSLDAVAPDGSVIARNFVDMLVANHYPPAREQADRATILRLPPQSWAEARWRGGMSPRRTAAAGDACWGRGSGFFRWDFPLEGLRMADARRVRVLCEVSSCRPDASQTDCDAFPSDLVLSANGIPLVRTKLSNHPHDSTGSLSYLRDGKGAYGYLLRAVAEGPTLERLRQSLDTHLRVTLEVPADTADRGGLTVYGSECGRAPICPTVIVEW